MAQPEGSSLLTVVEVGRRLGVSTSTVRRMLRSRALRSIVRGGRRLIPADAVRGSARAGRGAVVPPLTADHPLFRLVGAGRSSGETPGARDHHGVLGK